MKKINSNKLDVLTNNDIADCICDSVVEELELMNIKSGLVKVLWGSRGEYEIERVEVDSEGNFEVEEVEDLPGYCIEDMEELEEEYYSEFEEMGRDNKKMLYITALGDECCDYYFRYEG